ncbi:snoRNA binding domain protein [Trichuris suis]|nr:snoRNA binding domain protein [Trichuris suis]
MSSISTSRKEEDFAAKLLEKMFYHIKIDEDEIWKIIDYAADVLLQEETLTEICAPVCICGDTHGQYYDLLRLFDATGWPPRTRYLFLGDYVDRGRHSVEVILMMLVYKVLYPTDFFILRGNHECMSINRVYGFYDECVSRYSLRLYLHFQHIFDCLPVAALINNRIFCMHGGLSPSLANFNQIRLCTRPIPIPEEGLLCDLLWADPKRRIKGWKPSERGAGYVFGADVVETFCRRMDIDLIARAHQVVDKGYEFFANHQLVTIFSAPNYCNEFSNSAGIMQAMSLADELLADLEDEEPADLGMDISDDFHAVNGIASTAARMVPYDRVTAVAHLLNDERFKTILNAIEAHYENPRNAMDMMGPVESDPEYRLIVEANSLAADIDNEIIVVHKFVRDKYSKRFPELESLVPMPLEYVACVKELGNDILEKAKNNEHMQSILLPATVIVISVTAATTQGELLTAEELEHVMEACDMTLELNKAKGRIYEFVEARMAYIAPNLSYVVGPEIAAKLMGTAGGITQLSKIPACNLLVLGAHKRALSGFSSTTILPHTGYVYYTSLVQMLPPDLRRRGARLVAAKCTLAARVDAIHAYPDSSVGRQLAEEIRTKFDKWQEPPPKKQIKPLPKPLDQASKKRGGRRVRKMKERLGLTELRRKANRMNFGELEEDVLQEDMSFTLGQIKSGGPGGRLRTPQIDQKTRVRMSKALQKNLQKQQGAFGGATSVRKQLAGTVSTVTFTPVQGLEIVNPQAAETERKQMMEPNAKYFAEDTKFIKVQTPLPGIHPSETK